MKSHGPLLDLDEALRVVRAQCRPLPAEEVPVAEAAGRVLAAAVRSPWDLPGYDLSMMDGWAVRSADAGPRAVAFERKAGDAPGGRALAAGEAARIFTGAPIPPGADAVVMQEHTRLEGGRLTVEGPVSPGQHVRRRGDELFAGAEVLPAGCALGAAELALCASAGAARVQVHRRPRVALLATGDELVAPGTLPGPGQLVESNTLSLAALCREAGAEAVRLGQEGDDPGRIAARLAGADAELLVTTGGASLGDHDHAQAALERLGGTLHFHALAIRPGKPILFGTAGTTRDGHPRLYLGLPGNPAAAMLGQELFVRLAVRLLQGDPRPERAVVRCVLRGGPIARVPGLVFFPRGQAAAAAGRLTFTPHAQQSSMQISSWAAVNALARIPPGEGRIEPGEELDALLVGPLRAGPEVAGTREPAAV